MYLYYIITKNNTNLLKTIFRSSKLIHSYYIKTIVNNLLNL